MNDSAVRSSGSFTFIEGDLVSPRLVRDAINRWEPELVLHLAAQAGVRYSLENPMSYIENNIVAFQQVIDACREARISRLYYASSSSVYGERSTVPFRESDRVDSPASLYAATKKSNELVAQCYANVFGIASTGLRFFTVYGPHGRPDMAYFSFADKWLEGRTIDVYCGERTIARDFTYIDDVVEAILRLIRRSPEDCEPCEIFNVGKGEPDGLLDFIYTLELSLSAALGRRVEFQKRLLAMAPGDVSVTYASVDRLRNAIAYQPQVTLAEGLREFAEWYVCYRGFRQS